MTQPKRDISDAKGFDDLDPTGLGAFLLKCLFVSFAAICVMGATTMFLDMLIEKQAEKVKDLKGGKAFWLDMEKKLYEMAAEPDIPAEKKQKIVEALRKVSAKYQPYMEAVSQPAK